MAQNKPYVKQYDANGNVSNPIKGSYLNKHPNRKERRKHLNHPPFIGNSKGTPMTIFKTLRYMRVVQVITDKEGKVKRVKHYLPA